MRRVRRQDAGQPVHLHEADRLWVVDRCRHRPCAAPRACAARRRAAGSRDAWLRQAPSVSMACRAMVVSQTEMRRVRRQDAGQPVHLREADRLWVVDWCRHRPCASPRACAARRQAAGSRDAWVRRMAWVSTAFALRPWVRGGTVAIQVMPQRAVPPSSRRVVLMYRARRPSRQVLDHSCAGQTAAHAETSCRIALADPRAFHLDAIRVRASRPKVEGSSLPTVPVPASPTVFRVRSSARPRPRFCARAGSASAAIPRVRARGRRSASHRSELSSTHSGEA